MKINVFPGVLLFLSSCNGGGKGTSDPYELHAAFGDSGTGYRYASWQRTFSDHQVSVGQLKFKSENP